MVENVLARRYAKALLRLAEAAGRADEFADELDAVRQALAAGGAMDEFWANKAIDPEAKRRAVDEVVSAGGLSDHMGRLIELLFRKERLVFTDAIAAEYRRQLREMRRRKVAKVLSAQPLSNETEERLRKALCRRLGVEDVMIEQEVRPGLLAGVVVRVDCSVLDGSLRGRLDSAFSLGGYAQAAGASDRES